MKIITARRIYAVQKVFLSQKGLLVLEAHLFLGYGVEDQINRCVDSRDKVQFPMLKVKSSNLWIRVPGPVVGINLYQKHM